MAIKFLNTVQVDTDVLYVDAANDRVGIGLSSPSTTLHVDGFTRMNGGLQMNIANAQIYQILDSALRFGTNNTERMRISSTGNVGIGTTSPSVKLEVDGRVKVLGTLDVESDFPRINLTDTNNDSDYSILNANGSFRVYDNSNDIERLSISSSGNVGIGTTSPSAKLFQYLRCLSLK